MPRLARSERPFDPAAPSLTRCNLAAIVAKLVVRAVPEFKQY